MTFDKEMSREKRKAYNEDADGRARKRRRTTEVVDIEDRLESLITRVGEKSTSSLESNLEGLASVLEADLPNYKERILKIICTCASNLPEKITVYSTLVGLLNAKNYSCGEEFLDMILENLKDVLVAAQFDRARLMVRFLADLVNCRVLMPSALLEFFNLLIAATMEDDTPQVRSDWFAYTVLSSLPWAGKELAEKKNQEFGQLLLTMENYISQRSKKHVTAVRVWSTDEPHPQEEYLDCLWAQIQKLKSDNWQEKHIRRPYLAFDDVLGDALEHTLPSFKVPLHKDGTVYPLPNVVYRMFDYTDVPEGPSMPGAHAIERYLVEETIRRTLSAHFKDRKECANQLLNLPGKSKVPTEYCIIEVLFSEMFRLPNSHNIQIFYGSLIIELCKLQPNTMPGVVAQATELLYERLDAMNVTCVQRFVQWFSYHLSNFQFKWGWDEWVSAIDTGIDSPRCVFLTELFEKMRRSSYHQFLVESIPEGLQNLLPIIHAPNYRFTTEQEGIPGADIAKQFLEAVRAKKDIDDLQTILNSVPANAIGQENFTLEAQLVDQTFPQLRLEVLMHVVLKVGSKSFSHSFSALTKFHKLLKNIIVNEEAQIHCLKIVSEFWSTHPQFMVVLIDKLVRMQVLDCSAVVNWIFSKDMKDNFTKLYVWEIMTSTLKKMSKHTNKVTGEVHEAKEKLAKLEERAKKQPEETNGEAKTGLPTDDHIEEQQKELDELTEKLENAERAQKQLFLIVFQRFIMILTEHIVRAEQQQLEVDTQWFKYTTERLREVLITNYEQVFKYLRSLETLLFTADLDSRILSLFSQFKALRT